MSTSDPDRTRRSKKPRGREPGRHNRCIAILVKRFPRLSETFVLNEFLELRRLGVPVRMFALEDPNESRVQTDAADLRGEVVYLRDRRWTLVAAVRWTARRPFGVARMLGYLLRRRSKVAWRHAADALTLGTHMRRIGAAHLHAHFAHSPTETAYLAHLATGVPFSFTAHAKDLYTTPESRIVQAAEAAAFITTCTEANGAYLSRITGREVLVYPHGVDLERFGAIVRQPVPGRILSVGRLIPKKGHGVLLSALGILSGRGVSFECRIVGGGPDEDELIALARKLGLRDRVTFAGAQPQDALTKEYAAAEIFVLAPVVTADGDRDGLPNVLLEAMAAGIPVVSSTISGIPELVTDEISGILVPPGDAPSLAVAVQRLLTDSSERKRLASAATEAIARRSLDASVRPFAARLFAQLSPYPVPDACGTHPHVRMSEDRSR